MSAESKHLVEIIERHNHACTLQVVFVDIENYSKRRTLNQVSVIEAFTKALHTALNEVGKKYLDYAQANHLNFKTDVITIPTGDGAAVIFSFDGLADVHLVFARELLKASHEAREGAACETFAAEGWCNCHSHFNLRIGIAEGRGIVYIDVNNNYNVAGNPINMASRVMTLSDRNQILFTEDAYRQIIDMTTDASFLDQFVEFRNISIKHGLKVNVYQYTAANEPFLNNTPPDQLLVSQRFDANLRRMESLGFHFPAQDKSSAKGMIDMLEMMTLGMEKVMGPMLAGRQAAPLNEPATGTPPFPPTNPK